MTIIGFLFLGFFLGAVGFVCYKFFKANEQEFNRVANINNY